MRLKTVLFAAALSAIAATALADGPVRDDTKTIVVRKHAGPSPAAPAATATRKPLPSENIVKFTGTSCIGLSPVMLKGKVERYEVRGTDQSANGGAVWVRGTAADDRNQDGFIDYCFGTDTAPGVYDVILVGISDRTVGRVNDESEHWPRHTNAIGDRSGALHCEGGRVCAVRVELRAGRDVVAASSKPLTRVVATVPAAMPAWGKEADEFKDLTITPATAVDPADRLLDFDTDVQMTPVVAEPAAPGAEVGPVVVEPAAAVETKADKPTKKKRRTRAKQR